MWEFKVRSIIFCDDSELQEVLNAYGKDGWELVMVKVTEVTADNDEYRCIMKRAISVQHE